MNTKEVRMAMADMILESYIGAREANMNIAVGGRSLIISQEHGSDYLIIHITEEMIWYQHDNFPFPKRHFQSDIPTSTLDEFESDLRRMNIPIPERKVNETHA